MQLSDMKKKHLTDTGAVSTDATPSKLYYAIFSGATVGDSIAIKDGATTIFTLLTSVANAPVELNFLSVPEENVPFFTTDIDTTVSKTANVYASFLYREVM